MDKQDRVFLESESDNWFKRNRAALDKLVPGDTPLQLLSAYPDLKPKKVLEVGCSSGWRLAEVNRRYGAECFGAEPSAEAIAHGQKAYPNVKYKRAVASELPFDAGTFDLVIINYVLHWVSRPMLLKAVSELDRVLKDGGYLLLGDFLPDSPAKVPYHHRKDETLYTYKQDYARLFETSALYTLVGRLTTGHSEPKTVPNVGSADRYVVSLLRKSHEEFYPVVNVHG
ncbi:MAG: class I SAM-dependent methyltransferase [Deltaproteobacteria bacterium]|nr:class I SAM-dependent methyltransferase [Deltaproteobacteria bacterium]